MGDVLGNSGRPALAEALAEVEPVSHFDCNLGPAGLENTVLEPV